MSWWRRNRWWLIALPFAVAVLAAASTQRIVTVWLEEPLRSKVAEAAPGEPVHVTQEDFASVRDEHDRREFTVELLGVEEAEGVYDDILDEIEPFPDGATGYEVTLRFDAPVDSELDDCDVILVDANGNRYGEGLDPTQASFPCERDPELDAEDEGYPEEWTNTFLVLTATDVDITEVWLTFALPSRDYVVLPVRSP